VVEHSLVVLPSGGGEEQVLTSAHASIELPSDWSLDGNWVLASTSRGASRRYEICWFAASAAPRAEIGRRVLVSDPELDLWHARLSPDGSWVSFHSVDVKRRLSNVHARRAEGGPWVPITAGEAWNGKARWSNDGRALFFLSNRTGLFEIWSVRFDPVVGRTVGQPFKVSRMEGNGRGISLAGSPPPGLSFAAGRLVVPLKEVSGSVWMLESARR
jgi:Tol biopolymer transport system component